MIDRSSLRAVNRVRPEAVVFDLGGVLIDWDPRHLYRKLYVGDEAGMEWFLANVCTGAWNVAQDGGRTFAEGIALLEPLWPEHRPMIRAFHERWVEMLGGPIHGTVAILEALKRDGVVLHALTNWSAETFPIGRPLFPFLEHFGHIVVSGEVKMLKPDPAIYRHLVAMTEVVPERTVYIDDSAKNAEGAAKEGFIAIRFESPEQLAEDLKKLGLPVA